MATDVSVVKTLTMVTNITLPTNLSISTKSVIEPSGPSALIIVLIIVSVWIILVNALVLLCLIMSHNVLQTFVYLQILSLSVTDTLVGFSALPVTMTFKISASFPYFGPCAAVLYGYSAAQAATLYHAFIICIHRLIMIKKCTGRKEPRPTHMYKTLIFQVTLPWFEGLFVVLVPFLVFGKYSKIIQGCSLNTVFEDDYLHAMTFLTINLLIPQIGMNVIYIYMLFFLRRKWKRIHILREPSSQVALTAGRSTGTSRSNSTMKTGGGFSFAGARHRTEIRTSNTSCIPNAHEKVYVIQGHKNLFSNPNFENRDPNETGTCVACSDQDMTHRENCKECVAKNDQCKTQNNKRILHHQDTGSLVGGLGKRGQKDVLITIGLLLLFLNVFMTPLTFLAVIEGSNAALLSRTVKFVIMVFALMNSALNPFIYVLRIKPFRLTLKNILRKIFSKLGCR